MISIDFLREYMNDDQQKRVDAFLKEHGKDDTAKASCRRMGISGDRVVTILDVEGIEEGLIL